MSVIDEKLIITPWHPIRAKDGQWRFPAEMTEAKTEEFFIESYYNFIL